jgi:diguanylate cyclase (GGDEF)-like protein
LAIAHERLTIYASTDSLTSVLNRGAFTTLVDAYLTQLRAQEHEVAGALLVVDADHFKHINDRHGHPGGDCALRHLGAILAGTFRQVDVVARVGGEEFAVLLPSSTLEGAAAVAERLRQLVAEQPATFEGERIAFTISAGVVAAVEGEPLDLDTLMKRADQALYAAKAGGRNRVECWNGATDAS